MKFAQFVVAFYGSDMRQKELGKTGVFVPEIGIGTWQYSGGPELLRRAADLGAVLIDTAESYGNEEVVGRAIKGIRERIFIATKVSHWRREEVLRSAEASLRKLGIDYIDLYQIHWPNGAVPIEETMSAMEDLVDQGKVKFLGVSNFSNREFRRAQAALRKQKIVSNQLRYSLVERTIEPRILPYCQQHQVTVLAFSPLGHSFQKMLSMDPHDALGQVAREIKMTKAQVALNWCICKAGVVALPKTESSDHVAQNCLSSGWNLTDEQIDLLNRNVRFRRRSRLEQGLRRFARDTRQRFHPG